MQEERATQPIAFGDHTSSKSREITCILCQQSKCPQQTLILLMVAWLNLIGKRHNSIQIAFGYGLYHHAVDCVICFALRKLFSEFPLSLSAAVCFPGGVIFGGNTQVAVIQILQYRDTSGHQRR